MPTTYRATLTNVGAALVADAIAHGTTLTWAKMALGDGNGSAVIVDAGRTSLVNERYRAPLNDLGRDSANPNTIVGTLVVPPETGGWTIREFGIYDNASTPRLVAYGETPEIEKPASSAGTGINLRLRFRLVVSADANITLSPDSNEAYATIEYVKDNAVKSLSVSGRTITYTMGDGDTHTIQTQDSTYNDATQSVHGLMSVDDKKKLDGIAANAEVNQNAFSNFKVGNVTVAADSKTDTLELAAGTGITLTPDATNDKVTIKVTDNTYADKSHMHSYLPLSGGTLTGQLVVPAIISKSAGYVKTKTTGNAWGLIFKNAEQGTDQTPNNGIVIEVYKGNNLWGGQLYLPDNATNHPAWNGWSSGTYDSWKELAFTADIPPVVSVTTSGTGNAVTGLRVNNNALTVTKGNTFSLSNHTHNYVSKSGDVMTGSLVVNSKIYAPYHIYNTLDTGEIQVHGGSDGWHSGMLTLHGKNQSNRNGYFRLIAHDGTNESVLEGQPNGTLNWKSNPISVITAHSIGTSSGYIKLSDGLQLVWGNTGVTNNGTAVTFARAFASGSTPRVVFGESPESVQSVVYAPTAYPISATGMTVYQHGVSGKTNGNCSYIAIGKGA